MVSAYADAVKNFHLQDPCSVWHVLTEMSVPVAEFSRALGALTPVIAWVPEMSFVGLLRDYKPGENVPDDPALRRVHFPLQRGYARLPRGLGARMFHKVYELLRSHTPNAAESVLLCTSSYWARTAALWPGPVVYYATDRTVAYAGLSARSVLAADRRMCQVADLVCPNSRRLAEYLQTGAGCAANKITLLPNATRASNIRSEPFTTREQLPADVSGLTGPIVGVIGNMGDNIDWALVDCAMELVPEYRWLFVGPIPKTLLSRSGYRMRERVLQSPRALFVGARPYPELCRYARGVDVAVMPYNRIEPTYSGSPTRFYEHLAAGRPMLATRGVEELLRLEPYVSLVDTAAELAVELRRLLAQPEDGLEAIRCLASRAETWEARAAEMRRALFERCGQGAAPAHELCEA